MESSAYNDFVRNTLSSFSNRWQRILYCANLLQLGKYEHWGMKQAYGEREAQRAIAEAHEEVVSELLRMPLNDVAIEMCCCLGGNIPQLLDKASAMPPQIAASKKLHFLSVVETVSRLKAKA